MAGGVVAAAEVLELGAEPLPPELPEPVVEPEPLAQPPMDWMLCQEPELSPYL